MKVTNFTQSALRFRKQEKRLINEGYRRHETDWEIIRGGKQDYIISDAVVSVCGKYVYTKIEPRAGGGE